MPFTDVLLFCRKRPVRFCRSRIWIVLYIMTRRFSCTSITLCFQTARCAIFEISSAVTSSFDKTHWFRVQPIHDNLVLSVCKIFHYPRSTITVSASSWPKSREGSVRADDYRQPPAKRVNCILEKRAQICVD